MGRALLCLICFGVAGASAFGCGGSPGNDAPGLRHASPAAVTPDTPLAPVYFSVTNNVRVVAEVFASFELVAGARVELEVVTRDGSPLRFELLRLRRDGSSELLNAFHADSGFTLTSFVASADGKFILHFPQSLAGHDVVVHIECKSTGARCGPSQTEGQVCMVARDCADGLACYPSAGACNAEVMGGTCVRPIGAASCDGDARVPVCGCDGRSYDNACLALAAGVGLTADCAEAPLPAPPPR